MQRADKYSCFSLPSSVSFSAEALSIETRRMLCCTDNLNSTKEGMHSRIKTFVLSY